MQPALRLLRVADARRGLFAKDTKVYDLASKVASDADALVAMVTNGRPKKFINGEGFYYLGESYRLLLIDPVETKDQIPPLQFQDDWFLLQRNERRQADHHFVHWYTLKANEWLRVRTRRFISRIDVQPTGLDVRHLGFRWGSCSPSGRVNFHWRTILLPPEIIDYIIVHELVHLRESHHNSAFWLRVERVIPDYVQRKQWLSENGCRY